MLNKLFRKKISLLPGEESVLELSDILPQGDTSINALPADLTDQVIGTVEGHNLDRQTEKKSDYNRIVDYMNEQFVLERKKMREEADLADRERQEENMRLREVIREEQDETSRIAQAETREEINATYHSIEIDVQDNKDEAEIHIRDVAVKAHDELQQLK